VQAAGEFGERDVQRAVDEALFTLGAVAHVQDQRRFVCLQCPAQFVGGRPAGLLHVVGRRGEAPSGSRR